VAGLAGVFGHVRGDLPGFQLAAVLRARQHAGVQLLTEADRGRLAVAGIPVEACSAGGLTDRLAQLLGRDLDAWYVRAGLGAVQANDGVEVHQAAGLELGDLRERHADPLPPGALAHAGPRSQNADQLDHKAVPQRGGVPVPQHRALVVIRGRVDRLAKLGVIALVALAAAARPIVVGAAVDSAERRCRE
jgi:hypothetical protein